jgi:hypothetical protein
MAIIKILRTHLIGDEEHLYIWMAHAPGMWQAEDAKAFLHALQRMSATVDRPLVYVDVIRLHESARPTVVAIEVVTNAGIVMSEPLRVSFAAWAWFDKARCDRADLENPYGPN